MTITKQMGFIMLDSKERIKLENVKRLIRRNAKVPLEKMLHKLHPADLALIITHLSDIDRKKIWSFIEDRSKIAKIILEMQDIDIINIIDELSPQDAAALLSEMDSDDASYILRIISKEKQQSLLQYISHDELLDVEELLHYPEDSAGSIMNTAAFALHMDTSVKEATKLLHKAEDLEMVFYLYVVDGENRLAGVLSLRQLILNPPDKKLSEIMINDAVSVTVTDTQEYVAELVEKYDFLALPVVDEQHRLCGIITIDDVIDIIKDQASEDIYAMAGVTQSDLMFDKSPYKVARTRLPWLIVTFLGEILAGLVVTFFQGKIADFAILVTFMPIVMAMGGNVGSQSATVIIQGVAMGKINTSRWGSVILKETLVGVLMGLVIGILLGVVAPLWEGNPQLGIIVGVAIFSAMLFASLTGSIVPITLMKLKFDPAIASAPFITALNDITGLTIYFVISMSLLTIL